MRRTTLLVLAAVWLVGFSACSYIFYPRADEFAEKAKGPSTLDTMVNLTTMLYASANAAKDGTGYDPALNDLHNQFHALDDLFCDLTKDQMDRTAYARAVTQNKELWTIFKRVWKFKDDPARRADHLDLFARHVADLRDTLQSLK
jgi:hypothetical protein